MTDTIPDWAGDEAADAVFFAHEEERFWAEFEARALAQYKQEKGNG